MKKYLKTGVSLIGTGVVMGSIPTLSGTTTEATLKSNFSTGLGNMGKALPVMGSVKGTQMVLKSVSKLKPIKMKGKYKL